MELSWLRKVLFIDAMHVWWKLGNGSVWTNTLMKQASAAEDCCATYGAF